MTGDRPDRDDQDGVPTDEAIQTPSTATDAAFSVLASCNRRAACRLVAASEGEMSVEDLAAWLAESGESAASPAGETDRTRHEFRLRHVDLPKLADAGVVDYEPSTGTVQYVGDPLVEQLLVAAENHSGE